MTAAHPARILAVAGPDPGHALPALGVAAALATRRHDVRFATGTDHRDLATALGVAWVRLPALGPTAEDEDLAHRLWRRAGDMAPALHSALGAWRPDLVVADILTTAGRFLAGLLDVPWVEVIPHHLPDPDEDLPPVGLGRRPARTALRRWDDRRLVRLQRRSLHEGVAEAAAVASRLGLADAPAPALRLVATLPGLERHRRVWPAEAHVVGPLAVDPLLEPLPPPEGDEPLVLITDTTASGAPRHGFTAEVLAAFQHTDLRVVVTSGRLRPSREGRMVVGRGPHTPLLREAAVAAGHGGGGFTGKAFAHGVPQVVVPLQGDQREAAARVLDAGAGRVLRPDRLTPRRLRWAVLRLVHDDRARKAAEVLRDQGAQLGPEVAADLVEQVLAGRPPMARGPDQHLRVAGPR